MCYAVIHPPLASSDHHMVNLSISISIPNEKYSGNCSNIPDLARADWASICALMKSTNWHYATQYWEVFTNYQYYYCKLCSYVQEYWHYKSQTTSYSYKETCIIKLSYWKLYSRFRTNPHRIKYITAAKKYSKAVMGYTSNKELRLIESNNIGKFYKYVHCKLNGSNGTAPLKDDAGYLVYIEKAELLNKLEVFFTKDNGFIDPCKLPSHTSSKLERLIVTPEILLCNIKKFKSSGGAGPDGLPSEFYKNTASFIAFPLSVISNMSLQTVELPDIWPCASITPLFKKGSPAHPSNYKPISFACKQVRVLH